VINYLFERRQMWPAEVKSAGQTQWWRHNS